jgi:Tol biopolymer transport system component
MMTYSTAMVGRYSKFEILHELEAILTSREFANAERLSAFLRYVVENSVEGKRECLKESVIGTEVFGRVAGYDPKVEPIVRTEARRLRARIEEYYSRDDRWYRVRISIPKGSYAAAFEEGNRPAESMAPAEAAASVTATANPPAPEPVPAEALAAPQAPKEVPRPRRLPLLAAAMAVAGALLVVPRFFPAKTRPNPVVTTLTSFPGRQEFPTLSPDGNEVAFAWSSDERPITHIYVAPVRGGDPQPITSGPGDDSFPEWSPDGSQIAFVQESRWLVAKARQGGGERRLGKAYRANVSWSPDGRWIAHSAWTADDKRLALFETDPVAGRSRQITFPSGAVAADVSVSFSPDGRQIGFIRCGAGANGCAAYVMPSEGGTPHPVITDLGITYGMTWTPDGRGLMIPWRRAGFSQLWRTDLAGPARPEVIPVAGDDVRWAKLGRGPNGRVVYEQYLADSNIWRLDVKADATFGEGRRLIASTRIDSSPQLSPDGLSIVFVSDRTGYQELWRADADGRNQTALTHLRMQSLGSPRWSPDGTRIAFDAHSAEGRAIFVMAAAGGAPRQWTKAGAASRPSWSRDQRFLYYADTDSGGKYQILKVAADEAQRTPLQMTTDGASEAYEALDGQTLYFVRREQLRRMPSGGGPATVALDRRVWSGWWSVTSSGIFFADLALQGPPGVQLNKGRKAVYRWNPATGALDRVAEIDGDFVMDTPDFCVSQDGKTILYSRLEVASSQVRMIEGL